MSRLAWAAIGGALLLFLIGAFGGLAARWGYALLVVASLLLGFGLLQLGRLVFTERGDAGALFRDFVRASLGAVVVYIWGVGALGGFFVYETFQGRMEWHWIIFGPLALAALIILDIGFYRRIVVATQRTWARYGHHLSRTDAEPAAARRSFVDEVLLHRTLYAQSRIRWLRHTLILWGFGLMFLTELSAVFFREVVREWGWPEAWQADHPLRLIHDLAFDLTGLMVLAGCLIALWWRFQVRGRPEVRYTDTPTVIFLLVVVVGGFWAEALRISGELSAGHAGWSFVGYGLAKAFMTPGPVSEGAFRALWIFHAVSALAFIAYVPVKRLIHSCATPMGRIMNSQERLLRAKKTAVAAGLLKGSGG